MVKIIKEKEEVVTIGLLDTRTIMPSFEFAKQRVNGIWKGHVKKIEVKTTYLVADEKIFEKSLDDVKDEILKLESDLEKIGSEEVSRFIGDKLKELYRKKSDLQYSLEIIDKNWIL